MVDFARALLVLALAREYEPTVLFLNVSPSEATARRIDRDGRSTRANWLKTMRGLPALGPWSGETNERLLAAWALRVRRIWGEAGAHIIDIDGDEPAEQCVRQAVDALDL